MFSPFNEEDDIYITIKAAAVPPDQPGKHCAQYEQNIVHTHFQL